MNESNLVLVFTGLLAALLTIMVLRFNGRRKRMLANQIPGEDGNIFFGMLLHLLDTPENLLKKGREVYRR